MKRKVIQLAHRTLVVSLPSPWAKKYNIKKGDELEVDESEKNITYSTTGLKEEGIINLNLNGSAEFMKRRIGVAYKKGFDEVHINFEDDKTINLIQEEIKKLVGFEITHHSNKNCTIKNIADTLESEFDTMLRRIFVMLLEFSEESLNTIKQKDFNKLEQLKLAEETNDKFTDLCKRIINKKGYHKSKNANFMYCILWNLEKIADQYENICNLLEHKPNSFSLKKETLDLFQDVNVFLRNFYELFYKFSEEEGNKLTRMKNNLNSNSNKLLLKASKEDLQIIYYLKNTIGLIYDLTGPFYAMNL
tara:strand:+ start:80 stop:991 length:912 start_codon:yes stop_codon:yes gene_type:complete